MHVGERWSSVVSVPIAGQGGVARTESLKMTLERVLPYWHMVLAPAGTPKDIVARVSKEVSVILADKAVQETTSRIDSWRDGETIDALQYLCGQIASRAEGDRLRVMVDAGDYRARRAESLERLAAEGELMAFRHPGFWQPMDTLRDKHVLEDLWQAGKAPWKTW